VDDLRRQLKMAANDSSVKAIILRVNSPGGGATASDTMYHELSEFKKKSGIPVVAFFQDVAASGGYYVAMAADEIVAQPTTITGSIGVIAVFTDVTGMLEKIGVKAHVLRSSEFKASMNPLIEKSAEDLKQGQVLIDSMYQQFYQVVAKGRPNIPADQLKWIANGRVWMGATALQIGLVDHIGYFRLAQERAEALAGRSLRLVTYTTNTSDSNRTYYTEANVSGPDAAGALEFPAATALAERLGLTSGSPGFLYYWSP
jgi:protease-4